MEAPPPREIALRWLLALGCAGLLGFFFSPPWSIFLLWARVPEMGVLLEVRRGAAVLFQVAQPGAEIPDPLHGAIQWRLLFPLLGRWLHLPSPVLFGLASVGCVAVLGFIISLLRRHGQDWVVTAAAALLLGATSWFFTSVSWLGYYDSWLVLGLLIIAFARSPWAVWAACVWSPWVDERLVLGLPLALLCRYTYRIQQGNTIGLRRETLGALALVGAYGVLRLSVLSGRSGGAASVAGYLEQFMSGEAGVARIAFGIWAGLRLAWWLVGLALVQRWQQHRGQALLLTGTLFVVLTVGLATAQDLSRSMMLLMPVAVLGALGLPRWKRAGLLLAGLTLLLPAHHVMSNRVNPVTYLYHELSRLTYPAPEASAELLELKGRRALEAGRLVEAAEALSLAIKVAVNPAAPSKQRGLLFATQQQWAAAREDFSTVVRYEPGNPDGWFLRAQAALALGDGAAANADFAQALAVAPNGWRERTDVLRFQTRLRAPGGGR